MTATRYVGLAVALVLLSACDPVEPTPPKSPPTPPAPVVSEPAAAAKAAPDRPPGKVEKPSRPVVKREQAAPIIAPTPGPAPSISTAAKEPLPKARLDLPKAGLDLPKAKPDLPKTKLDLRLPSDLVGELEPGKSVDQPINQSLLPPLFVEKPPAQGPFQLNGRLITNDREQDYWQSVEGAELQFEFKQ
ncbi:hypothetical protein [Pseudomonas cavernicola]|uniref:hypothetical protein n=1 Tax=Pseudomonas cavernicola TaxID=2320866 RepID=UPI0011C41079|nr:hypothetical protein [Pseudomonas cavernicola]